MRVRFEGIQKGVYDKQGREIRKPFAMYTIFEGDTPGTTLGEESLQKRFGVLKFPDPKTLQPKTMLELEVLDD